MLGLSKITKKLHVKNKNELCYDYEENDSQERGSQTPVFLMKNNYRTYGIFRQCV